MTETLHICAACGWEYESLPGVKVDFHSLRDDWQCPECGIDRVMFHHYDCDDVVAEMTGNYGPYKPFSTIQLEHQAM